MRFSVTSRRPEGVEQPPRQAAGHYGECLNWANALEQPPARLRGGLREGSQISAWSLASRKGALCPTSGLQNALFRESDTPRARLYVSRRLRSGALVHAVAPLRADVRTQECIQTGENGLSAQPLLACRVRLSVTSRWRRRRRMRFSVTSPAQNALFREGPRVECAFP